MGHRKKQGNYDLIIMYFIGMWVLTIIGLLVALLLPLSVIILLSILGIGLIFLIFWLRLGNFLIFLIPLLMGVFIFLVLVILIEWLGAALIVSVFVGTVIIFLAIAFMSIKLIEHGTSEAVMYALTILIVFVVFAFIYIFIPVSSPFFLVIAAIFVLAFALYTVYELDQLRNCFIRENEIYFLALRLYLNLAYLVLNVMVSSKGRR